MTLCEMTDVTLHSCEDRAQKLQSTHDAPYHFVGSGLDNVYLEDVTYYVCDCCGKQSAEIPALKNLFEALGRTIASKQTPLIGPELRFLRKRLAKKAVDFAPLISVTPQHLSLLENSPEAIDPGRDKLVRLIFRGLSKEKPLQGRELEKWLTSVHNSGGEERIYAKRMRNNQWKVEFQALAA